MLSDFFRTAANVVQTVQYLTRRYGLAILVGLCGMISTALIGNWMESWCQARDSERFSAECRILLGMIEQKMERYESALGRLSDMCSLSGGMVNQSNWNGWIDSMGFSINFPCIRLMLVAPKLSKPDLEGLKVHFTEEGDQEKLDWIATSPDSQFWAPVWQRYRRLGIESPEPGSDLLVESQFHPSFEPALGATYGWISKTTSSLSTSNGGNLVGIWFAIPLKPAEFTRSIAWKHSNESHQEADLRRARQRTEQSAGLLAAFIDGECFLDDFNSDTGPRMVEVRLFTQSSSFTGTLFKADQMRGAPENFHAGYPMSWYGQKWIAKFKGTPLFESTSVRYRSRLVWWLGGFLSLSSAAGIAWQTRARWMEAHLSDQLRQSLERQERFSRDLHDGTLQSVFAIGLGLQRASRLVKNRPDLALNQLSDSATSLQKVIEELRLFIKSSDLSSQPKIPFDEALNGVVTHLQLATETPIQMDFEPGTDRFLNPNQSLQLLNAAREALSNCVRHSGARMIRISLRKTAAHIQMEISDDGCGFDPAGCMGLGRGMGNIQVRVRELSGHVKWKSAPNQGSQLIVELPLNQEIVKPSRHA